MSASNQAGIELPEGAFRDMRIEFVEEPYVGYTPDDPTWLPISDGIRTFNPGYGHELSEDAYLGNVDYSRRVQSESHEPELTYSFQQWLYDTNGDRQDLAAWGFDRPDGLLAPSVTLIRRQEAGTSSRGSNPASTVDARYNPSAADDGSDSTSKPFRVYDVLKGVRISEATLVGENGESTVDATVVGMGQRGRMYHIDQPPSSTTLVAFATGTGLDTSTNTDDTDLQVVVENEGATTTATYELDGTDATTPVTDANNTAFSDIDAIEVQDSNGNTIDGEIADSFGDVVVAIDDGDPSTSGYSPTEGEWLSHMPGSESYNGARGDEGIPTLGSGSHAGRVSPAGIRPDFVVPEELGIQRPVGVGVGVVGVVQTIELSAENDLESIEGGDREMVGLPGMADLEFTVSLTGETVTPALQKQAVTAANDNTRILFNSRGTEYVDLIDAPLDQTDAEDEGGEPVTQREASFLPQIGPDSGRAVEISDAAN
jgi:hypothetical protein